MENHVIIVDSGNKIQRSLIPDSYRHIYNKEFEPIYINVSTEDIHDKTSFDIFMTIQDVPIPFKDGSQLGFFDIGQLQYNVCTGIFHGIQMDITPFRDIGMSDENINNITRHLIRKMILLTMLIVRKVDFEETTNCPTTKVNNVIFDLSNNRLCGKDTDCSELLAYLGVRDQHGKSKFEININQLIKRLKEDVTDNTASKFAPMTIDSKVDFLRNQITGDLFEVPYIELKEIKHLKDNSITTTYQLFGKFLMFQNKPLDPENPDLYQGMYRFMSFLKEIGVDNYEEIGKIIGEKINTLFPGFWDFDEDEEDYDKYNRKQLKYSVLASLQRRQNEGAETYTTKNLVERKKLSTQDSSSTGLKGSLAFEMLTFGNNEIWRDNVLPYL